MDVKLFLLFVHQTFEDLEQEQQEEMPETVEEEEKRWSKRTQKMQSMFERAFTFSETLSFKDMAYSSNRFVSDLLCCCCMLKLFAVIGWEPT